MLVDNHEHIDEHNDRDDEGEACLHQTPAHCEICTDLGLEDGHSPCRVALSAHPAWEALEVVWTVGMPTSTATELNSFTASN